MFWFRPPIDQDDNSKPTERFLQKPTTIGVLHLIPKMHKKPVAMRPIIANPAKPDVPTARVVNAALSFINSTVCDQVWYDLILVKFGLYLPRFCALIGCEGLHAANSGILQKLMDRKDVDASRLRFAVYDFTSMLYQIQAPYD